VSKQSPIKFADLATHWGVSRPYVRKLVLNKGLPVNPEGGPAFTSLSEADEWLTANAPLRKPGSSSTKKGVEVPAKNARSSEPTATRENNSGPGGEEAHADGGEVELMSAGGEEGSATSEQAHVRQRASRGFVPIDTAAFVRTDVDFDQLMIEQAERVPQIAFGLLELKQKTGSAHAIAQATENWHQAVKAAASVRTKFLDLQERTRALIALDQVMDVVGTELQAVRSALAKLGESVAQKANPDNPALALAAINAGVDDVCRRTLLIQEHTEKELAS
jgi:hypothetical protein